jgi:hypothetical protein
LCQGGSRKFVRTCPVVSCDFHFYRLGHNPNRKGIGGRKEKKEPRA